MKKLFNLKTVIKLTFLLIILAIAIAYLIQYLDYKKELSNDDFLDEDYDDEPEIVKENKMKRCYHSLTSKKEDFVNAAKETAHSCLSMANIAKNAVTDTYNIIKG